MPELGEAVNKYAGYFNIQFELGREAEERCKHPLVLRLFCEAYAGRILGDVQSLPVSQVFDDFLARKCGVIADHFGLTLAPEHILAVLSNLRAEMWRADDRNDLDRAKVEEWMSSGLVPAVLIEPLLTRLLDEGLLSHVAGPEGQQAIRFTSDELGDYLLYRKLLGTGQRDRKTLLGVMRRHLASLSSDPITSERFLTLLARNSSDRKLIAALLDEVLPVDLAVFARCARQRLAIVDYSADAASIVHRFAMELVKYYENILDEYFPSIKSRFDPFIHDDQQGKLGITITADSHLREISYLYQMHPTDQQAVEVNVTANYPTWYLGFGSDEGMRLPLHDPEKGIVIPLFRGFPEGVQRTLNPELHSPCPGATVAAPDRVALHDIWEEFANAIDSHQLPEPRLLAYERAIYLRAELPPELGAILDPQHFQEVARSMIDDMPPGSPGQSGLLRRAEQYLAYLNYFGGRGFTHWLPEPDNSPPNDAGSIPNWQRYSDGALERYLAILAQQLVVTYRAFVDLNLARIGHRLNLYHQWPFMVTIFSHRPRQLVRILVHPVDTEANALLRAFTISSDTLLDADESTIQREEGVTFDSSASEALRDLGRDTSSTYPIDVLIPIGELFSAAPLNTLVNNWIKTELAGVLGETYNWPIRPLTARDD